MRSLLIFSALSVFVTNQAYSNVLPDAQIEQLANDRQWLSMLHYEQIGVIKQQGSQIEDSAFFLASTGHLSAKDELVATINAFQQVPALDDPNNTAQCRFPGRLAWLQTKLPDSNFIEINCPEFNAWKTQINAEKVYLVFPSAYLNSPSSMYGHTLFRVKKQGNDTPLLDFAINYAANTDPNDNQLVFSYKGLTGGYPGVVSVMPYYQKVKEYNFLENRDIWEYELLLTDQEVDQFIRHIWEMKSTSMPYYFFSQNCSYQLLTMLDAASSRLNLASQFSLWAIPADTVREIKAQGVLGEVTYRSSSLNNIQNMLKQVDQHNIDIAKRLVELPSLDLAELNELSTVDQAKTLDIAYEYSRYLSARKKSTLKHLNSRSIKLLSLRSKLSASSIFSPVEKPLLRDDQGHETARIGIAALRQNDQNYGVIDYRPSFHDVLDPQGGYLKGAELSMFSGSLRFDDEDLQLNHFNIVNIHSMAPTNALMTPKSWHINVSLLRDVLYQDELIYRAHGGAGITKQFTSHSLLAGFLNGRLSLDNDFDKGYVMEAGPELKWVWNREKTSMLASYQYLINPNKHDSARQEASVGLSYQFAKDWQWRASYQYLEIDHKYEAISQLSTFYYF